MDAQLKPVDHVHPVDEVLAPQRLLLLGLQHVLVMAASPITAVFLVGKALNLPARTSGRWR
jgi:xanthine/uracil permease